MRPDTEDVIVVSVWVAVLASLLLLAWMWSVVRWAVVVP
jgi:hypothetical protein